MFIDPNVATPVPAPMRAMYRDKNGVEHKPAHVTEIDGEWFDAKAIAARKKAGLKTQ